jgi:hypothetical protein
MARILLAVGLVAGLVGCGDVSNGTGDVNRQGTCVAEAGTCGPVVAAAATSGRGDEPGFAPDARLLDRAAGAATVIAVSRTDLDLAIGDVAEARFHWPVGLPEGIAVGDTVRVATRAPWNLVATDSFTLVALAAADWAPGDPGPFPGGGAAGFEDRCGLVAPAPGCEPAGRAFALSIGGTTIAPGGAALVGDWLVQVLSGYAAPPETDDGRVLEGMFFATATAIGPGCADERGPAEVCRPDE